MGTRTTMAIVDRNKNLDRMADERTPASYDATRISHFGTSDGDMPVAHLDSAARVWACLASAARTLLPCDPGSRGREVGGMMDGCRVRCRHRNVPYHPSIHTYPARWPANCLSMGDCQLPGLISLRVQTHVCTVLRSSLLLACELDDVVVWLDAAISHNRESLVDGPQHGYCLCTFGMDASTWASKPTTLELQASNSFSTIKNDLGRRQRDVMALAACQLHGPPGRRIFILK